MKFRRSRPGDRGEHPLAASDDRRALLVASGDGWSLVTPSGRVLVRGHGRRSRRRCLEFAQATGILAIHS